MIKVIAFDLMGVVFKEGHIVRNILHPILADKFDYKFLSEKYWLYDQGNISNEEFWNFLFDDKEEAKLFQKDYLNKFELDDNFHELIAYLKEKYSLGIISNLPKEWGDYLIEKHKFSEIFEPIILSGNCNIAKPNPAIFELFAKLALIDFSEIVFIDDKPQVLVAAKDLGMNTVLLNKEILDIESIENKGKIDYFIRDFKELKNIL